MGVGGWARRNDLTVVVKIQIQKINLILNLFLTFLDIPMINLFSINSHYAFLRAALFLPP